jgi:hypothetical protein
MLDTSESYPMDYLRGIVIANPICMIAPKWPP